MPWARPSRRPPPHRPTFRADRGRVAAIGALRLPRAPRRRAPRARHRRSRLGPAGTVWRRRHRDRLLDFHVDWCNRGLATRASALTDAALSLPEVEVVVIVCDVTNAASAAVPRKLGFTLDGIVDADRKAPATRAGTWSGSAGARPTTRSSSRRARIGPSPALATRCTVPPNGGRRRCTSCCGISRRWASTRHRARSGSTARVGRSFLRPG